MADRNTDKSTTSTTTLQAIGACFKLPIVATARGVKTSVVLMDSAATALEEEETRLKKAAKHTVNEVINVWNMGLVATHRANLEIANSLDVKLSDDLDEMIEEMDRKFYEKKAEENK